MQKIHLWKEANEETDKSTVVISREEHAHPMLSCHSLRFIYALSAPGFIFTTWKAEYLLHFCSLMQQGQIASLLLPSRQFFTLFFF